MKIIFIADIHIKLGQKNVPRDWQKARVMQLAEEINKDESADYIVIGGDLLDVATPSVDEVGLMFDFLAELDLGGYIIPGNHEMVTKTRDCFLPLTRMLTELNFEVIREFTTIDKIDYIPYNILNDVWPKTSSKISVTHVRGEIPPHVAPEIDLSKYENYESVFAGDLHSYKNSQLNLLYPGSPFTTSFHRNRATGSNGYFIIDTETGIYDWKELDLPQLIRASISSENEIVKTKVDHTIYELEGNLAELAGVQENELLSKKVTKSISQPATLALQGDIVDELVTYLEEIKGIAKEELPPYMSLFKSIVND